MYVSKSHPDTATPSREAVETTVGEREELLRLLRETRAKLTGINGEDDAAAGELLARLEVYEQRLDEGLARLAEAERRLDARTQAVERLIDEAVRERVDAAVKAAVNEAVAGARSRIEAAATDAAASARRQLVEIERDLRAIDARAKATSDRVLNRLRSEADEEVRLTQSEADLSIDWLRERAQESISEIERSVQRKLTQLRAGVDQLTATAEGRPGLREDAA